MHSCSEGTDADNNRDRGETHRKAEQDSASQDVDDLPRKFSEQADISDQNSASADGEGQHHKESGVVPRSKGAEQKDEGSSAQAPPIPEIGKELGSLARYKMSLEKKKSIAVIITNTEFDDHPPRPGAQYDERYLYELFDGFGYDARKLKNLSNDELNRKLRKVRQDITDETDSLVVTVSSHGAEDSFYTKNDRKMIQDLVNFFTKDCPALKGKPKLFFIQACRGNDADSEKPRDGTATSSHDSENGNESYSFPRLHRQADILIAYASPLGHVAYRDPNKGSYFILVLCQVFKSLAAETDVLTMLTWVAHILVTEHKVTLNDTVHAILPSFVSQLTKQFFFTNNGSRI